MGNVRAKVTDFGMAKLGELNPHLSNTMCPGTDVYMPPEATQEQPVYSAKIDCFSFGVLIVQILTRQFPNPGNRQRKIDGNHPDFPGGTIMVCVPERDRRQNHLRQIDPKHPLLCIALDCLRDKEGERPTAHQICERVVVLKNTSVYGESSHKSSNSQQVQGLQQIIKSQMSRLEEKDVEIQQLNQQEREKTRTIQEAFQMIALKDQEIERLRQQQEQDYHIIKQKDAVLAEREYQQKHQIQQLQQQLQMLQQQKDQIIAEENQEIQQLRHQHDQLLSERQEPFDLNKRHLQVNNKEPYLKLEPAIPAGQKAGIEYVQKDFEPQKFQSKANARGCSQPLSDIKLMWREGRKAPRGIKRGSNAGVSIHERVVYVLPFSNHNTTIYKFEISSSSWCALKSFPFKECSLTVVKDLPIVVGGRSWLGRYSNKLYSFTGEGDDGRWSAIFSSMPTERANATVLVDGENVFVVGGENEQGLLTTVEIMNTETQSWCTASPLPKALVNASMVVCGGDIYMLGGKSGLNKSSRSAYACSLDTLLNNSKDRPNVWRKVADLPLSYTTCVSLYGRLIAVDGADASNQSSRDVYVYNLNSDSWKAIGQMLNDRHSCFVAVLPEKQLMVVGGMSGSLNYTDSVEFGSTE